jgi:hypothetical protein
MVSIDDDGKGSRARQGHRQNGHPATQSDEAHKEIAPTPVTPDELRPDLAVVSDDPLIRYVEEEELVTDANGKTQNVRRRKALTIRKIDWKLATAAIGSAVIWGLLKIFGKRGD